VSLRSFRSALIAAILFLGPVWVKPAPGADPGAWGPPTAGPIIVDNAVPVAPGSLVVQPYGFLRCTGGHFTGGWRRAGAGGDFTSLYMPVQVFYGVAPNMEVNLIASYLHNWAEGAARPGIKEPGAAAFGGLGDTRLTFKYQLVSETATRPTVTALAAVDFPAGHHLHLNPGRLGTDQLGTGAFTFTPGFNLSKYLAPFKLYANLWYSLFTAATVGTDRVHPRDRVTVNLAAEYPLSRRWVLLLEGYSQWDAGALVGPRSHQPPAALVGVLPGIEFLLHPRLYFELGASLDLAGKNTDCRYSPVFTMIFTF